MNYRIKGLDPAPFTPLFALDEVELDGRDIVRMEVASSPGSPCRITLDDVEVGTRVLLLNHVTVARGPFATSHAIFVSEGQERAALYEDEMPPALDRRMLSLRAFGDENMMVEAALAQSGEGDTVIRRLFADPSVRYVHAHYATRGCFAALVERA